MRTSSSKFDHRSTWGNDFTVTPGETPVKRLCLVKNRTNVQSSLVSGAVVRENASESFFRN